MAQERPKVLVVDDDARDLGGIEQALTPLELDVETLLDAHQVLDKVAAAPPDLVILDALLPGVSGFDLCRRIKETPGVKAPSVLMVTGVYLKDRYRQEAVYQFHADGFLTKPFRRRDLHRFVVKLLAKRRNVSPKDLQGQIGAADVLLPSDLEEKTGWLGRLFGKLLGEPEPASSGGLVQIGLDDAVGTVTEPGVEMEKRGLEEFPGRGDAVAQTVAAGALLDGPAESGEIPVSSNSEKKDVVEASHSDLASGDRTLFEETEGGTIPFTPRAAPDDTKTELGHVVVTAREPMGQDVPGGALGEVLIRDETTKTTELQAFRSPESEEQPQAVVSERSEAPSESEPSPATEVPAGRPVPVYEEEDFLRELRREVLMCKRLGRPLTLILVRIGDLGEILELFGKDIRSRVLVHVVEQAAGSLREIDMVGLLLSEELIALTALASDRYGGDRIISRLRTTLKHHPFRVAENIPSFIPDLHFGIASFPSDVGSFEDLLRRARQEIAV